MTLYTLAQLEPHTYPAHIGLLKTLRIEDSLWVMMDVKHKHLGVIMTLWVKVSRLSSHEYSLTE